MNISDPCEQKGRTMSRKLRCLAGVLVLLFCLTAGGCGGADDYGISAGGAGQETGDRGNTVKVEESGEYTSKEEVAAYIHTYGHLPDNYITKKEAKALGWDSRKGNLGEAAPGKSIGGDPFGNYEGLLPEKPGRKYYECDIGGDGGYRGAERIVYSDDGLVYYTEDHYESFDLLYEGE